MLRITVVSQTPDEVVLRMEGWVSGTNVELLKQEVTHWFREAKYVVLDLTNIRFIDEAGITLLQGWSKKRLMLRGGSLFVHTLLEAHGLA
jgi:anti-anti-sigma factor